ncbi:uncharacterized [Tachysurus ichikawai]
MRVATCPLRDELTLTRWKESAETLIAVVLLCRAPVICSAASHEAGEIWTTAVDSIASRSLFVYLELSLLHDA